MEYRRVVGIIYNNKHFEIFKDSDARYAVLEYNDDEKKYHFPELVDLVNIVSRIIPKKGLQFLQSRPHKTKNKKYKFKNFVKVPLTIGTVLLSSSLLFSYLGQLETNAFLEYVSLNDQVETEVVISNNNDNLYSEQIDYENLDGVYSDDAIPIDPSLLDSESSSYSISEFNKIITVTNTEALDSLLGYKFVTEEQIIQRINEKNYSDEIKAALIDFVKTMNSYYNGEIDFRIFFENLKTLRFKPYEGEDDSCIAYYDYINNVIYISPDLDFSEGFDMLTLRHELGHVITSGFILMDNDYHLKKTFFGTHQDGMYSNEALTVLFTTYPFLDRYSDDVKENMGYPLATNIYRAVVLYMDNYSLAEMSRTDIYYFIQKMNEKYSSFTNATTFVDKFEFQISQYYNNDFIVLEKDSYYIYETIADIYLSFAITSDMSADEINEIRAQAKEDLKRGITTKFKQNFSGLDDAFDEYIESISNKKIR